MMIIAGQTAHFVVSYDDSLSNGNALAQAILSRCEQDMSALSTLYGGIMPNASSLPFQVNLEPGGGGAQPSGLRGDGNHLFIGSGTILQNLPGLVNAEVVGVL